MPESDKSFGSISKGIKDILDGGAGVIDSITGLKYGSTRVGSTDISYGSDDGDKNPLEDEKDKTTIYIIVGIAVAIGLIFLLK